MSVAILLESFVTVSRYGVGIGMYFYISWSFSVCISFMLLEKFELPLIAAFIYVKPRFFISSSMKLTSLDTTLENETITSSITFSMLFLRRFEREELEGHMGRILRNERRQKSVTRDDDDI